MREHLLLVLAGALACSALGACLGEAPYHCTSDGECPVGYRCDPEPAMCRRVDWSYDATTDANRDAARPDTARPDTTRLDAATIDAPGADSCCLDQHTAMEAALGDTPSLDL